MIYNAIIRSKVMYGLETVELTQAGLHRLNVFQLRGLRQILKMTTTYINRENTNVRVLQEAEKSVNAGSRKNPTPFLFLSEVHDKRRVKWCGKVLRLLHDDPRFFTTYTTGAAKVKKKHTKRVGRPRLNWAEETHKRAWKTTQEFFDLGDELGDPEDAEQVEWVRDAANMFIL